MTTRKATASEVSFKAGIVLLVATVFVAAFGRIHLRVETTLVGYELGRLKALESRLLEERAELRLELAKMTTRQNLTMMIGADSARNATASNTRTSTAGAN